MFNDASPIPGTSRTLQGLYETCSYNQLTFNDTTNHVVDLTGVPGPCYGSISQPITINGTLYNLDGYPWDFTVTCGAYELLGIAQWAEQYITSVRSAWLSAVALPTLPRSPHKYTCPCLPAAAELGIGLDQPDLVPQAPAHPACHLHMRMGRHGLCGLR